MKSTINLNKLILAAIYLASSGAFAQTTSDCNDAKPGFECGQSNKGDSNSGEKRDGDDRRGDGNKPGGNGQPQQPPQVCEEARIPGGLSYTPNEVACLKDFYSAWEYSCNRYSDCDVSDYYPGNIPSDNNTTMIKETPGSQMVSLKPGTLKLLTINSSQQEIYRTYSLQYRAQKTCMSTQQFRNFDTYISSTATQSMTVITRDCRRYSDAKVYPHQVMGHYLDTLMPQYWSASDTPGATSYFQNSVSVTVTPNRDFPADYEVNTNVSQAEGRPANVSASGRYFRFSARKIENPMKKDDLKNQAFAVDSVLAPIMPANNTTVSYDAKTFELTIKDPDVAQLAKDFPENRTEYQIAVYVNWNRVLEHKTLGDVVASTNAARQIITNNLSEIKIPLRSEFMSSKGTKDGSYASKLAGGGKDWAIYVEVTPTRYNKYVQSIPGPKLVTEIKINKQWLSTNTPGNWTDSSKYIPKN